MFSVLYSRSKRKYNNAMIEFRSKSDNGSTNGWMVTAIVSFVFVLVFGGLAIWAYLSYDEQKTNVDGKISDAVATAVKKQSEADAVMYDKKEKNPYDTFYGPYDYGSVSFQYPKTWSVYVANDAGEGGDYEAYFYKDIVPAVSGSQQFMLRVAIQEESYDKVVSSFDSSVQDKELTTSAISVNGANGVRLDGNFSDDIRGAAVIFKIRDKTLVVRTDADTFKTDFDTLIKTIKFE